MVGKIDDADRELAIQLLARTFANGEVWTRAIAEQEDAQRRVEEAGKRAVALKAAFGAFGFDPDSASMWEDVRAALGDDDYARAARLGRPASEPTLNFDDDSTAVPEPLGVADAAQGYGAPSIRAMVAEELKNAGPAGAQAAAIRRTIENRLARKLHDKTIGMTLYRLARSGAAHRSGRTWFASEATGAPEAEAEHENT